MLDGKGHCRGSGQCSIKWSVSCEVVSVGGVLVSMLGGQCGRGVVISVCGCISQYVCVGSLWGVLVSMCGEIQCVG